MAQSPQDALGRPPHHVVKGGDQIELHQRDAIDGEASDLPGIAASPRHPEQADETGERENGPDHMGHAVEDFAAEDQNTKHGVNLRAPEWCVRITMERRSGPGSAGMMRMHLRHYPAGLLRRRHAKSSRDASCSRGTL